MARTLTPAERRELGEAVLVRLEEQMRVTAQMIRYARENAATYGGGTWRDIAAGYRLTFRSLYRVRAKARRDVEFNRAIPPVPFARPWNEAVKEDYAPDSTWTLGGDNAWGAGEAVEASRG